MQVVVDSLLTSYRHQGDGKPAILVLHGWGDAAASWQAFGRQLADSYDIYALDLPGFGASDRPPQAWGLDEYAGFIGHFLKKIGVQPYAIIGHSNGGAIAIRGLANGQLQTDKLVLLASAGVRSQYKGRKKALRLMAKAGKVLAMPLPVHLKDRLRRKMYTTIGSDMLVAENLQATFKRIVNDDVAADAARLRLPTLLVYGEDDVSTPPDFGTLLHDRIPGSRFELLTEAGHFVHNDQPAKVLKLVRKFLS